MSLSSHTLEKLIVEHYVYGNYSVPSIARKMNISEGTVRQILKESTINPFITSDYEFEVIMDKSYTLADAQPELLTRIKPIYCCYEEVRQYIKSYENLKQFNSDAKCTIILYLAREFCYKFIDIKARELGYQNFDIRRKICRR